MSQSPAAPMPQESKNLWRQDLVGHVFRHLTVIGRVENAVGSKAQYRCVCDCGIEKVVRADNLTGGRTVSCGHVGYGAPYSVIGAARPIFLYDTEAESAAHRERVAEARRRIAEREAVEKAKRAEEVRVARNARRRERYRQRAIESSSA